MTYRTRGITGTEKRLGSRQFFKSGCHSDSKTYYKFLGKNTQTLEPVNLSTFMFSHTFIHAANKLISELMTPVLFWVWGTASFIMSVFYNITSAQLSGLLSAEIPWKLQDQHREED